jgi:hypothetical protein
MKNALCVLFFLLSLFSFGQSSWQKTYGGTAFDNGYYVEQTSDGGFIITGLSYSYGAGQDDAYLLKTDSVGSLVWTKTIGGSNFETGWVVRQTSDLGFIIIGSTSSFGSGNDDIFFVKTDLNGDTLWTKTFGGTFMDRGASAQQTLDSGYIITGTTGSFGAGGYDVCLIKTDASGNLSWTKTFGSINVEWGVFIQQTTDGGYIIVGDENGFGAGDYDIFLIKTDSAGNLMWTKTFGGINLENSAGVQQTADGGFIIVGETKSFGAGLKDVYLIKTDSVGDSLWTKVYGGAADDFGQSVRQTSDSGYIVSGITGSFGFGLYDAYLIKTNSTGDTLWTKTFGGPNVDLSYSVQQTLDGGYIVAGNTGSFGAGQDDIYLIKTDSMGNSACNISGTNSIITPPGTQLSNPAIVQNSPTPVQMSSASSISNGGIEIPICASVGIQSLISNERFPISIFPNLTHSNSLLTFTYPSTSAKKEIIIYSIYGKEIARYALPQWSSMQTVNLPEMAGGVYVAKMVSDGGEPVGNVKFVIE